MTKQEWPAAGSLRVPLLAILFCLLAFTGCANRQQELIESELRKREAELMDTRMQLGARCSEVQALEMEIEALQRRQVQELKGTIPPQIGSPLLVQKVALGRLTGGYRGNQATEGDDGLQVIVEPKDADGSTIKAPGTLKIEAFEVGTNGIKTFLSSWELSPRELRQTWANQLIGGSSYRVVVPWKSCPATEKLKVAIRFMTLDGQPFEAEKEVTVRPLMPKERKAAPAVGMSLPPGTPRSYGPMEMPAAPTVTPQKPTQPMPSPKLEQAPPPKPLPDPAPKTEASTTLPTGPAVIPAAPVADEALGQPKPLTLPPMDPPVSFEMKPFTQPQQPVLQAGHQQRTESRKGEERARLGLPVKR